MKLSHCIGKRLLLVLLALFLPPRLSAQIKLYVSSWADSKGEIAADENIVAEFMRLHPGVEVSYEPALQFHAYEQKIITNIVAGAPPDVFLLDSKIMPSFINKGVLLDLMPYVATLGLDLNIYFPNVLAIAQRDSALYAFPKDFTPMVISFNKKLFREMGIAPPEANWTWEDFLAIAQKLTRDTDNDGRLDQFGAIMPNTYYSWITLVWTFGGDVLDPTGRRASGFFDSRATEAALQFFVDLHDKYQVAPNTGAHGQSNRSGVAHSLFMSNHVGMRIDGHWNLVRYLPFMQSGELELGVAPLPSHNGRKVNVMYESGWCVPRNTKHPELAAALAAFLSGEYACRARSALALALPAVKSVAAEQAARDTLGIEQVFFDEVQHCRQPWGTRVERFTELELLFQDALDETLVNHRPLHESLTQYAKRIDAKLEQIHASQSGTLTPLTGNAEILRFLYGVAAITFALALLGVALTRGRQRSLAIKGFLFLLPSAAHLIVFLLTPIAFALYLSVHDWEVIVPQKTFVGLKNFGEMFGDDLFWNALKNTLVYSLNVPLCMVLALAVAVMLHQKLRGVNLLRTLYFLPSVSSFVAIALVWRLLYEPNFGMANYILQTLGLPQSQWLNAPSTAMLALIIMSVWLGLGYQMVIFLAGLQGIPEMLYEAATIDGASAWQRFRNITLPQLRPTTFFVLVTSLIGSFQVFTTVFMMTGGGPARSTDVVVFHIYQAAWDNLRMGYASAMSMALFVIIMLATWVQFKLMRQTVE